jgi:hypothetical protein
MGWVEEKQSRQDKRLKVNQLKGDFELKIIAK